MGETTNIVAAVPRVAAQIYYEHMSHGQVLDEGRNQGLDFVGIRLLYRFDTDAAE